MKLFEYEAKKILGEYGVAIPIGRTAATPGEAAEIAREIGKPVAIKSQVLVSGRGKAGGILFAATPAEAEAVTSRLLGSEIKGSRVNNVLVEEKLEIARELYASVAVDARAKQYVVMASSSGGMDVESAASASPGAMFRRWFGSADGFSEDEAIKLADDLGLSGPVAREFGHLVTGLCRIALEKDAELVEVNPVAITASGLMAIDARMIIDDNALFRHSEFQGRTEERAEHTQLEIEAKAQGLAYVDLPGDIGIIGNGAGLVMATLDMVDLFGGKPANFLDIGGGATPEIVKKAVLLVSSKPGVKAVLVNILGGITRCDLVAEGVIAGLREAPVRKPVAVRMMGTNEEQGTRMLEEAGVHVCATMEEAVEQVLAA